MAMSLDRELSDTRVTASAKAAPKAPSASRSKLLAAASVLVISTSAASPQMARADDSSAVAPVDTKSIHRMPSVVTWNQHERPSKPAPPPDEEPVAYEESEAALLAEAKQHETAPTPFTETPSFAPTRTAEEDLSWGQKMFFSVSNAIPGTPTQQKIGLFLASAGCAVYSCWDFVAGPAAPTAPSPSSAPAPKPVFSLGGGGGGEGTVPSKPPAASTSSTKSADSGLTFNPKAAAGGAIVGGAAIYMWRKNQDSLPPTQTERNSLSRKLDDSPVAAADNKEVNENRLSLGGQGKVSELFRDPSQKPPVSDLLRSPEVTKKEEPVKDKTTSQLDAGIDRSATKSANADRRGASSGKSSSSSTADKSVQKPKAKSTPEVTSPPPTVPPKQETARSDVAGPNSRAETPGPSDSKTVQAAIPTQKKTGTVTVTLKSGKKIDVPSSVPRTSPEATAAEPASTLLQPPRRPGTRRVAGEKAQPDQKLEQDGEKAPKEKGKRIGATRTLIKGKTTDSQKSPSDQAPDPLKPKPIRPSEGNDK